jgi:hypothetical protein
MIGFIKPLRRAGLRSRAATWLAGCVLALAAAPAAEAASVRFVPLDEMIDSAALAFHGKVIANRVERDALSRSIVTYTTFEVIDNLKGAAGATHTIKQIGGILPDGSEGYRVHGVPSFAVGEEVVVYLAGASQWGFSSPIGLQQGRFEVSVQEQRKVVSNGHDFRLLVPELGRDPADPDKIVPFRATPRIELTKLKQLTRERVARTAQKVLE